MKQYKIAERLLGWFEQNARDLPWRRSRDPYAVWVSEIMLQQTQVKTVMPYWERWMLHLPNIASLAKASPERIHKLWEGLGYYTRVRNMQKAAREIVEEHGGKFPEDYDDVFALPGIGRYTAGAICSIAFNQPKPILDGNVIRVLTRLEGISGDPRSREVNEKLWRLAEEMVTEAARLEKKHCRACSHLNQALMELGALICAPKQPRCDACPVAAHCVALRERRVEHLPALPPRAAVTHRRFAAFVAKKGPRFLVRQRPAGVVNAHLWEFPNVEVAKTERGPDFAPFHTVRHSITRYRIQLDAYRLDSNHATNIAGAEGRWFTAKQLTELPFTSAHKKILLRLLNGG